MKFDKETRRFLDRLISGTPDYPRGVFTYEYLTKTFEMDEDDVLRLCADLEAAGALRFSHWDSGVDLGVSLTQRGKAYKEYRWLEAKEKWLERLWGFLCGVITGVAVAFLIEKLL